MVHATLLADDWFVAVRFDDAAWHCGKGIGGQGNKRFHLAGTAYDGNSDISPVVQYGVQVADEAVACIGWERGIVLLVQRLFRGLRLHRTGVCVKEVSHRMAVRSSVV